jgi:phosphohistidine phosphatase
MKSLLLLRHAKSSWKDEDVPDHDRPLKKRGQRDAPRMGKLLRQLDLVPELIVSSTALRARATALAAAEEARYAGDIRFEPRIYEASASQLLAVVRALPDGVKRAMIVGHNPGLEELVTVLSGAHELLSTGALAHLEVPVEQWMLVTPKPNAKLAGIWRPKELSL